MIEINKMEKANVKELCERCDMPRSTLYRHLNELNKEGLVKVVGEVRKRGTVERTYSMVEPDFFAEKPNRDGVMAMLIVFCMDTVKAFDKGLGEDVDPSKNAFAFTTAPVFATDEEVMYAVGRMGNIVQGLMANEPTPERKLHSIRLIVTPSEEGDG